MAGHQQLRQQPRRPHSAVRSRRAARVARHHDQPRRQGRQGRPPLLVHRARRGRRRQRPRRPRLRQGQGSAAGDPEGHRRGQAQPVRRAARRQHDHPPDHRRHRRRPRADEAGRCRYRRHRRRRRPHHPRGGRRARRAVQVARLVQRTSTSPAPRSTACKSLQRPDEVAERRGLAAEEFVPKGMLNAYNERQKQIASRRLTLMPQTEERHLRARRPSPSPRSARRSPPSRRPAARCVPSASAGSARPTPCPTAPRSGA